VDTLEALAAAGDQLLLLIGSETFLDLLSWRAPRRIAELAQLVVVPRTGSAFDPDSTAAQKVLREIGADGFAAAGGATVAARAVSSVSDYFLVCSGKSSPHLTTIVDAIRQALKEHEIRPLHAEGAPESGLILLDYGDVLMHVFMEDTRAYYALERLWGDAPALV